MKVGLILCLLLAITVITSARPRSRRSSRSSYRSSSSDRKSSRSRERHVSKKHQPQVVLNPTAQLNNLKASISAKLFSRQDNKNAASSKSIPVKVAVSSSTPLKVDRLSRDATPDCYLVDRQTTECGHSLEVIMKNMKPCFDQNLLKRIVDKKVRVCRRTNGVWNSIQRAIVKPVASRGSSTSISYVLDFKAAEKKAAKAASRKTSSQKTSSSRKSASKTSSSKKVLSKSSSSSRSAKKSSTSRNTKSSKKSAKSSSTKLTLNGEKSDSAKILKQVIMKTLSKKIEVPKPETVNIAKTRINTNTGNKLDVLKQAIGQSLMNPKPFFKVDVEMAEKSAPAKPLTAIESLKLALKENYLNRPNRDEESTQAASEVYKPDAVVVVEEEGGSNPFHNMLNIFSANIFGKDETSTTTTTTPERNDQFEMAVEKLRRMLEEAKNKEATTPQAPSFVLSTPDPNPIAPPTPQINPIALPFSKKEEEEEGLLGLVISKLKQLLAEASNMVDTTEEHREETATPVHEGRSVIELEEQIKREDEEIHGIMRSMGYDIEGNENRVGISDEKALDENEIADENPKTKGENQVNVQDKENVVTEDEPNKVDDDDDEEEDRVEKEDGEANDENILKEVTEDESVEESNDDKRFEVDQVYEYDEDELTDSEIVERSNTGEIEDVAAMIADGWIVQGWGNDGLEQNVREVDADDAAVVADVTEQKELPVPEELENFVLNEDNEDLNEVEDEDNNVEDGEERDDEDDEEDAGDRDADRGEEVREDEEVIGGEEVREELEEGGENGEGEVDGTNGGENEERKEVNDEEDIAVEEVREDEELEEVKEDGDDRELEEVRDDVEDEEVRKEEVDQDEQVVGVEAEDNLADGEANEEGQGEGLVVGVEEEDDEGQGEGLVVGEGEEVIDEKGGQGGQEGDVLTREETEEETTTTTKSPFNHPLLMKPLDAIYENSGKHVDMNALVNNKKIKYASKNDTKNVKQ